MSGCGRDNKVEAKLNQGGVRIPRERHKYTARRGDRTRRSEVMKIVSGKNPVESERGVEMIKSQESEIADISSVEGKFSLISAECEELARLRYQLKQRCLHLLELLAPFEVRGRGKASSVTLLSLVIWALWVGNSIWMTLVNKELTPGIAKFSVTGGSTPNANFRVQQKLVRKAFSD
ncbi:hypothetical protein B0H13DRAFT_1880131 [Mycena leptocephala]|nr:hypothetical protein B0H13DRAFT_1880131 [Mycena leptocephala]